MTDIAYGGPSRELDLLVAQRVMNDDDCHIVCPACGSDVDELEYSNVQAEPIKVRCHTKHEGHEFECDWRFYLCPDYSDNIESAWEVVEQLRRWGVSLVIELFPWEGAGCTISIRNSCDEERGSKLGNTGAATICHAALHAVDLLEEGTLTLEEAVNEELR
jgi:hypothetical protein